MQRTCLRLTGQGKLGACQELPVDVRLIRHPPAWHFQPYLEPPILKYSKNVGRFPRIFPIYTGSCESKMVSRQYVSISTINTVMLCKLLRLVVHVVPQKFDGCLRNLHIGKTILLGHAAGIFPLAYSVACTIHQ